MRGLLRLGPLVVFVFLGGTVLVGAGAEPQKLVKTNAPSVASVDGAVVYAAYCVSCHGTAGRGDGPAAALLTKPVPDLTRIWQRDGTFDRRHVMFEIVGPRDGGDPMPNWGRILEKNYGGDKARAQVAEHNLARYLESLQTSMAAR